MTLSCEVNFKERDCFERDKSCWLSLRRSVISRGEPSSDRLRASISIVMCFGPRYQSKPCNDSYLAQASSMSPKSRSLVFLGNRCSEQRQSSHGTESSTIHLHFSQSPVLLFWSEGKSEIHTSTVSIFLLYQRWPKGESDKRISGVERHF